MLNEYALIIDFLFKATTATVLGSLLGIERQFRNKPAGIKTHALICLGAACFTFLSYNFPGQQSGMDPTRIAAQVVSGVGFLGAGTIFMARERVHGLTSAAMVWIAATIGMLIGAGFEGLALLAVAVIEAVFFFFKITQVGNQHVYNVSIKTKSPQLLEEIKHYNKKYGIKIFNESFIKKDHYHLKFQFSCSPIIYRLYTRRISYLDPIDEIRIDA